ncbi:MAG: hypothetical protein AAF489_04730 [Bacteroidota bacterium]
MYLDTELDYYDYRQIALTIIQSPFSLEQVKKINRREVFPVLYINLLSMTGAWAGFDRDWLVEKIVKRSRRRGMLSKMGLSMIHGPLKWMYKRHWVEIEEVLTQLELHPDAYVATCRALVNEGIEPFDFPEFDSVLVQQLKKIALTYRDGGDAKLFIEYLTDRNDFIHMWTGYLLVELFRLNDSDSITIYGENVALKENCLGQMELDLVFLKKETSRANALKWILDKKQD